MLNPMVFFGNILRPLLKICIQIKWIVRNKKQTKILRSVAARTVRLFKLSQKLWNKLICFAQLKKTQHVVVKTEQNKLL